jgi:hypothetical protein
MIRAILAIVGLLAAIALIAYDVQNAERWHIQRKTKSITDVDEFLSTLKAGD